MTRKPIPDMMGELRDHLADHPDDVAARLLLAPLLVARGERAAARALLEVCERTEDPLAAQVTAALALLDSEEGLLAPAVRRWERLLADDIDHPDARAQLLRLRGEPPALPSSGRALPTLSSPEGVTLLRYQIIREIGRGGTSTVYLALDQTLGIELALKVLHPQLAAFERSDARRRFFHEARVAAKLRHPGVVAIYDLDEDTRTLVMEFLPGGTLRDRIRSALLAAPEIHQIATTLLQILSYVHDRGVVHGDITPRNILLRAPAQPVLADFGNARLVEGAESQQAGTPLYLAPEQFRGAPPSPPTDLFSVGAILWELLVGHPMRKHADLTSNLVTAPPLPPTFQSHPLAALVHALTSQDPRARVGWPPREPPHGGGRSG